MKLSARQIQYISYLYKAIGYTLRYKPLNQEIPDTLLINKQPFIAAFWHNELISIPPSKRCYTVPFRCIAMTSDSRDGNLVEAMCAIYGIESVRGSSSRGGVKAIREMQKRMKEGRNDIFSIAVDGPRGPEGIVKPGAIYLANLLNIPIVTMRFLASPVSIAYKSWDMQKIPLPFSKTYIIYGEPYYVTGVLDEARLHEECNILQSKLNDISLLRGKK